jgi:hypothetical protein
MDEDQAKRTVEHLEAIRRAVWVSAVALVACAALLAALVFGADIDVQVVDNF